MSDVGTLALTIAKNIVKELAKDETIDEKQAQKEIEDIFRKHRETLANLPKPYILGLAAAFTGSAYDPKSYAATVGAMTDEELLTEINGTAAEIKASRERIDARDAFLKDLRDTLTTIARKAIIGALVSLV